MMEEDKSSGDHAVTESENHTKTTTRKNEKICNVKDYFPPLTVPKDLIHIVKGMDDWEAVAKEFLNVARSTKVLGYHSIYQLSSSDEKPRHPTSLLQLATIGGPILILQLTKLPTIPLELKKVLAEPGILKVGVNVYNLTRRLEKDNDLIIVDTVDLRALSEKVGLRERIFMSLPDLSKAFLKQDMCITANNSKSISARTSFWNRDELRPDQVHYAAVFAYAALKVFVDMVSLKIASFKTKVEDTTEFTEAWMNAQELWRDILNQDRKFTAFYCEICDVNPGVLQSYNGHVGGAKHKKSVAKLVKIEQFGELADSATFNPGGGESQPSDSTKEMLYDPDLWCKVCKVGMPGTEAMKQHMVGQKHRKKVKQKLDAGEEVECDNPLIPDEDQQTMVIPQKKEFNCEMCNLTVPTEASLEFHLKGKKHKKAVSRKEALAGMENLGEHVGSTPEVESDDMKRYCDACEVMVHNNQSWLMHMAGKSHKKNKERLDQLEVHVTCNSEFGAKRPTVDDLSGSVYCGICNTTVMASKENLDSHFQGKKHQARLREKTASDSKAGSDDPSRALNLTPRMVDIAKAVVGNVSAEDVGNHESGIYCKVCFTFVCGGKDALQSHLRGKKHLKNQLVIGKHKQPFKFPKARTNPYARPPRPQQPWQNSDIDDIYKIPGVPCVDFSKSAPRGGFNHNRNFPVHNRGGFICGTRGRGVGSRGRGFSRGRGQSPGRTFRGRGWGSGPNRTRPHSSDNFHHHAQRQSDFQPCQNEQVPDVSSIDSFISNQRTLIQSENSLSGPSGYFPDQEYQGGCHAGGRIQCNSSDRYQPYNLF